MGSARFIVGDVLEEMARLPDGSVDLVLGSPPFLALRSYLPPDHPDKAMEIGSEPNPGEFIDSLLDCTEEWRRLLAPHGSIAVELGDTYSGSGGAGGDYYNEDGLRAGQLHPPGANRLRDGRRTADEIALGLDRQERTNKYERRYELAGTGRTGPGRTRKAREDWPLDKSLCMIPELYRIALAYGVNALTGRQTETWRCRNVVRWCRPNPPVGALADKVRPATSDMLIACVGRRRYFDLEAIREPSSGHAMTARGVAQRDNDRKESPDGGRSSLAIQHDHESKPPNDHWWFDEQWIDENGDVFTQDAWLIPTAPYKGAHYACVDAETEALTPSGWRRHDEMEDGDLIAAYDATTDRIRWERAKFVRYETETELVAIDKEQTSQHLTAEHRMLVRSRKRPDPFVRLASEITSGYDLMLSAPWEQPEGDGPGPQLAALLGWTIAEGSIPQQSRQVVIYQSATANPEHCSTIRALLDASGAKYSEHQRERPVGASLSPRVSVEVSWRISGPVAEWLRSFPRKQIPSEAVFGWPEEDARALFDALVDGDGHRRLSDGRIQFVQRDRDTCDLFQALALRLGHRAVVKERSDGCFCVHVGTNRWVTLRGPDGDRAAIPRERYRGIVWCPQVSTTFWLARRDGKPFVTGNTWPPDLLIRPIKAMCPERVCLECGQPSERIVERESADLTTRSSRAAAEDSRQRNAVSSTDVPDYASVRTVGWTDCGHNAWRRGVVLDPFAGSGTTLAVAVGHGRDAIGIDLDARNVELAQQRVGMFLDLPE